uniref:Peptidase_S9_N domain-containing protein n=1 Tax=Caenorhabditis tropicalis TaxID=1561998 RepID=A0A1I7U9G7_9PELO
MAKKYTKKNRKQTSLPPILDPNRHKFVKSSFLIRHSDISPNLIPFIWSIENHVLLVKWVATEVRGQFRITNRYTLWNSMETGRYTHLDIDAEQISDAYESGIVNVDF